MPDDLDPAVVAYDQELVPWLFGHWAEPMVDLVAPDPSSRIADIACGSGLIVRRLLSRLGVSGRAHGVDIDAAMLAYAAATVDDVRVSWHESDAARLPFDADSIDRISCHQGLQFFPDRLAALAEFRRVLRSGGQLTVATWGRLADNPWPTALAGAVGQLFGDDAGAGMAVVCDLGDPGKLAEVLRVAGFEQITVDEQLRTVTHPDVRAAVAGQIAALPSTFATDAIAGRPESELVDVMCELLTDHTDASGRLEAPSTCNFAHGVNP